jgi:hypothetical protein
MALPLTRTSPARLAAWSILANGSETQALVAHALAGERMPIRTRGVADAGHVNCTFIWPK